MKRLSFSLAACVVLAACPPPGRAGDASAEHARDVHRATVERFQAVYADSSVLKVKPAFIPLPPGEVRPAGWLRDWAEDAARGITGHLDQRHPTFGEGWKGTTIQVLGAKPEGTGWPLEQCAYWLDGLVRLGYVLGDEALIEKARSRLDPVVDGTLRQGQSLIYWKPKEVLRDGFNNWAHSHMGRALVAYYEATGDRRILDALVKAYREYPLPAIESAFYPVNGMVNIDAMLDTYALSGDRAVLDNVLAAARTDAFRQTVAAWNAGRIEAGHAVICYENARVPALAYPWTGDPQQLGATLAVLRWVDRRHGLPMGLGSGEEYHAGIGSTRNVETCDVPCAMWTDAWMLRITGRRGFGDRIERVFFNAGPAPIARDFQTMSYYQCANRLSMQQPGQEPRAPRPGSYRFSPLGNEVLCCVGNANRIIPDYLMHLWMATADGGLAATLYGPCRVQSFVAGGVPVVIECRTPYPFEETIELAVRPAHDASFPLSFRVPAWCRQPEIKVNGLAVPAQPDAQGFVRLQRTWTPRDTVTLRWPMEVSVRTGRETSYPSIPYFAAATSRKLGKLRDIRNPYASVSYGPLLFALPIPDADPNMPAAGAAWNYALDVDPTEAREAIRVVRAPMPARWQWQLDSPLKLVAPAREFAWKPTETQPLPNSPVDGAAGSETRVERGGATRITLVPYGVTKFRVSMFPVTSRAWSSVEQSRGGTP